MGDLKTTPFLFVNNGMMQMYIIVVLYKMSHIFYIYTTLFIEHILINVKYFYFFFNKRVFSI